MPWKECDIMSERMKFVSRLLDGEKMVDLCKEFEISRKTGYKILQRYEEQGFLGLLNQSKKPRHHPNQTSKDIECEIIKTRNLFPTWGAPKIKAYLEKKLKINSIPARSTIHAILQRNNLIEEIKRRKVYKSTGTHLSTPVKPNDLWCTDFKGQFKMGNKDYCYPLTITDQYSRYLLRCEALENNQEESCIEIFGEVFKEFGIPKIIKSDNGVPFGSASMFGLSKLSVYWLRLGIKLERIKPGCPEQNGVHERMHRTLKAETTKPPGKNILSQQEIFDSFINIYNTKRPHESLDMDTPSNKYKKSEIDYNPYLTEIEYPTHDYTLRVSQCGAITRKSFGRVFIGEPFAGQLLGVKEVDEGILQVQFMDYELGFFDHEEKKLKIGLNPFFIQK